METGVDHLEAGISQCASDDLGASIMAVETGFGHDNSVATFHSLAILRSTG
jgi:hypothetical protein